MKNTKNKLPAVLQEKVDGSLGLLFHYAGTWQFATRNSFDGPHTEMAKQMLSAYSPEALDPGPTYVVEIVNAKARVVVDYKDREELVVLAVFHPVSAHVGVRGKRALNVVSYCIHGDC